MYDSRHSRPVKLGIFISMFPELHETFILRELAALERKGIDFKIVSLQRPRDPVTIDDAKRLMQQRTHYAPFFGVLQLIALLKALIRHPVKFFVMLARLTCAGCSTPKELLKSYAILPISFYFADWLRAQGIRHLHGHWANVPTTACWALSQVDDFSWSAAIHGEDVFSPNPLLKKKLNESLFCVVCTGLFCKHLQDNMHHTHPQDIHLNYHGLDPKVLERIEQKPKSATEWNEIPVVLSIGRLVPTKGHDDLIRAVKILAERKIPVKLSLIGSGPEESALKQLVKQLGIDQQVHFLGMMEFEAVMDQLQAADVFALSPRMIPGRPPDGIPNVIAEAMALGIPVVTTRASAIPELIDHEVNGLLIEPQDPKALAHAIARLLTDQAFSDQLTKSAKTKALNMFDQQKNINALIGLFEQYVGPIRIL
jgi:colanic acid/amylovoran biosynthesis glycosyltransferase